MKIIIRGLLLIILISCQSKTPFPVPEWHRYDEHAFLEENVDHENPRMRFKKIQSAYLDKHRIWKTIADQLTGFSEKDYERLKPLILEKSILHLQKEIDERQLTYERLTQWYLYRIMLFENDSSRTLHSIISINPNAVAEARQKDKNRKNSDHAIYGMPVLVKDNINTAGMPTTAGAYILRNHKPGDAEIIQNLKSNGGIVLGKTNLSEWAYYFCDGCPLGYSAMGGQSLNPYGRMEIETGGSSAGSATTIAANYAAVAIGTETSGSILSPSSQNSIVGLKPTVGTLSGQGIIPISRTLDTAGPMTRSVEDNAILFTALQDKPAEDLLGNLNSGTLQDKRFAAIESLAENDSLYRVNLTLIEKEGAEIVMFENPEFNYDNFLTLLNLDMKADVPAYLEKYASDSLEVRSIEDIRQYNMSDSMYIVYGQGRFDGIASDETPPDSFEVIKRNLLERGKAFFDTIFEGNRIDALLSVNNFHAGPAAVAHYPCITVPMGYEDDGEPEGLTLIAPSGSDEELFKLAYAFEKLSNHRKIPPAFD